MQASDKPYLEMSIFELHAEIDLLCCILHDKLFVTEDITDNNFYFNFFLKQDA